MYPIVRYLIHRPRIVNLALALIVAATVASAMRIKRLSFPRVDFQAMSITTVYPGAAPEDVELNVTVKLEEALKAVDGIEEYKSQSSENMSIIRVSIDPDHEDPDRVKQEIRRAIETVTDLPEEITDRPKVVERKVDNWAIYELALVKEGASEKLLRQHAKNLKERLLQIPEVSRVDENGVGDREFQILLNRKLMEQKKVSFQEVIRAIRQSKVRLSGGNLESSTTQRAIVTFSDFTTPAEVEKIIIRSNVLGNSIRIGDVGKVVDGFEAKHDIMRFNGQPGVSLSIMKKGHADVIRTVDAIEAVSAAYQANNAPEGLKLLSSFDASLETRNRLSILYGNAVMGFLFVVAILFFFLDRRIAFWTSMGIPFSIAIAMILVPLFGITINAISLCGLIVVMGMDVAEAIIIGEAVYREVASGKPPKEAALDGLKKVYIPVLSSVITTIVAFFPIYFIEGEIGQFSREIPSMVIIILTASLTEATFFLPAHLAHSFKGDGKAELRHPIGHRLMVWMEVRYREHLAWILNRKYASLCVVTGTLAVMAAISYAITSFVMFPIDQSYVMWVRGETARDSSLEFTARATEELERIIHDLPAGVVHSQKLHVGIDTNTGGSPLECASCFTMKLVLTPAPSRDLSATDVRERIRTELSKRSDSPIKKLYFEIETGGPDVGRPLEIEIVGNDNATRMRIMKEISADLAAHNVTDIDSNFKEGKPEIRVVPDLEAVAAAELSVSDIAATVRTAIDGYVVTHLQTAEERIPFRVTFDDESRYFNDPLRGLRVQDRMGHLIPLKNMVKAEAGFSPTTIFHVNGYRTNTIFGDIDLTHTSPMAVYEVLRKKYKDFEKEHPGFKLRLGGEAEESSNTFNNIMTLLGLAVLVIFVLLAVQFDSFTQPVIVVLSIPFGLAGIGVAFGLHGMNLSLLALVGIIGFTGVVVDGSLVMVDFINTLRDEGTPLKKAIVEGSVLRLRAVLLVTFTTVAGLMPTAYGIDGYDYFISPMVMAMAWGLAVGTTSILVITPLFYLIHAEITARLELRRLRRLQAKRQKAGAEERPRRAA